MRADRPAAEPAAAPHSARTGEGIGSVALVFLRLGATAFGGPAAHIAMMRRLFVEDREWLTEDEFLDLIGAANLLPGPTSTETAIYIGYLRAGWPGLAVAGICFILPAALMVCALAWAYVRFGHLRAAIGILYGIKPVIIAVVLQALAGLAGRALKLTGGRPARPEAVSRRRESILLWALLIAALALGLAGVAPLVSLLGAGLLMAIARSLGSERRHGARPLIVLIALCSLLALIPLWSALHPSSAMRLTLGSLFLFFVKVGSVVFGSGYVLLAFLRDDLVARSHWLSSPQLLDAIAVGQVTPGPVFTTATFIGYLLAGPAGAAVATAAIFLPGFIFVALTAPHVRRLRRSPIGGAFLDGVNVAAVALMAVVTYQLARAALVDWLTAMIALASAVVLFRLRINSVWLILAGALIGLVVR